MDEIKNTFTNILGTKPKVLVLLSTYNGEKFLSQQLDSLYNQSGVDIHILVRDDGSSDSTIEIIQKYKETKENLEILSGKNIGVAKSFFELSYYAQSSLPEYDYYAFCDQDDVWDSDKLISAINSLEELNDNKLYFCRANYVDANLNPIGEAGTIKFFDYTTCIYRNPALGCTMVFDKILLNLFNLTYPKISELNSLHDAWIFMCASFTGAHIFADNNTHIKYRQHGNNVTMAKKSLLKKYSAAFKRKFKRAHSYKQDREIFGNLYLKYFSSQDKIDFYYALLRYDSSLQNTLKYLRLQKWKSESPIDRILWNILVLFRKF